jgi:hypothetical protein
VPDLFCSEERNQVVPVRMLELAIRRFSPRRPRGTGEREMVVVCRHLDSRRRRAELLLTALDVPLDQALVDRSMIDVRECRVPIDDLPEGYVSLRCSKEGLQQKGSIFEMQEVPDNRYPSTHKELRLEMVGTGTISGTVTDEKGAQVTSEVHVNLEATGASTWGGGMRVQDGRFEFKNVPPDTYRISTNPRISRACTGSPEASTP